MLQNIDLLAKKIHETAVAKGWYETERTREEFQMLLISELAEATEEARKGTPPVYTIVAGERRLLPDPSLTSIYKPEGELIELADVIIRILDTLEHANTQVEAVVKEEYEIIGTPSSTISPLATHLKLVKTVVQADTFGDASTFGLVIAAICRYCEAKGWDINEAVRLKMAYNETRPHRHGGKLF